MKNCIYTLHVCLGLLFVAQSESNAQCLQNGGLEYGVATPGIDFPWSPANGWTVEGGRFEIWGSGFGGVTAYEGDNYAELNVDWLDVYYQDIVTVPGTTYYWSVAHRGRDVTNTANIEIGPVGGPYTATVMTSGPSGWVVYEGTYIATSDLTRLRLVSISWTGGCVSCGNLVDAVHFDADTDGDGIWDCDDNCTETANANQADGDGDGIGDVCDACPTINDPNCASCGAGKYLVCHVPAGNPENTQQLCLPLAGANTHIGNHGGCYWGLCGEYNIATSGNAGIDPMAHNDHTVHSAQDAGSPLIETENGYTYYFDVMPNPANDVINIHVHGLVPGAHLYVRDSFGRLVLSQPLDVRQAEFSVSLRDGRFGNGMHYVTVVTNGEMITRQLMVVK